jgi:hypothetical protein
MAGAFGSEQRNYGMITVVLGCVQTKRVVGLSCNTWLPKADDVKYQQEIARVNKLRGEKTLLTKEGCGLEDIAD